MTQEQPATDSVQQQGNMDSISAAAQALAQKRWAHRQPQEPEPANPQAEPETPKKEKATAPEPEEPTSESELEQGQDAGEEPEVDSAEGDEVEESDGDEPEEQPSTLSLDELDDESAIVIDGKEVTVREVRESRMRLDDYTRKTQALAAQRNTLTEREKLSAVLLGQQEQALINELEQLQSTDWHKLSQSDPQKFQNTRARMEGLQMHLQQTKDQQKRFLTQIGEYEEKIAHEQAKLAQKELKEKVPGWNNALYYSLVDYASQAGFDRDTVLKYTDPNIFLVLQKAKAYDEAKRITTKKSVKSSPKRTPQAKAPASPRREQSKQLDDVRAAAQKAGTADAAIELMRAKRAMLAKA